jgi:hypothetical protein
MRPGQIEEAAALAMLLGGAFPAERWEPDETELELFGDPTVLVTLVVARAEELLATASLQVREDDPTCAWIRELGCDFSARAGSPDDPFPL